ncbi:MAG: SAV_6107 family HEPN domain-containing protein [Micrococcales bacterium]|nr:SAV_6107 family HEPN domain-containing protein [Micrococcales bacterium]
MTEVSAVAVRAAGQGVGAGPVGLSASALRLLARADGELVAAALCGQPWERYLHAHLAALRAAAAVLDVRGTPRGRGVPRDVWGLAERVAPELAGLWAYFAAGAPLRAAVEAGRTDRVSAERADEVVGCAEQTVEAVRMVLGLGDAALGLGDGVVGVLAS